MSRSSSRLTSGRRSTPRTRVKIAALAPMPRARVSTTVITSPRSEEHTSELQSRLHLVCRLLLEKKINSIKNLHGPVLHHDICHIVSVHFERGRSHFVLLDFARYERIQQTPPSVALMNILFAD